MAEGMFIPDMVEEDDGGVAADHPPKLTLPVITAPFPEAAKKNFNALRRSLVTVACKDVLAEHYAFDSSVLDPKSKDGFVALKGVIDRHPGSPLSIFGHADPEGTEKYNKFLSERRAEGVFAMLIRDVSIWERLFSHHEDAQGDDWGDKSVTLMLGALGFTPDATNDETLKDVIKRFQVDRAIAPTGRNDKALRAVLFRDYMDFLCVDDKGKPYSLTKSDFLGEGATHGAFQGCSEFNPRLVLANSEEQGFEQDKVGGKDARATVNADNRRTMIFFFEAGAKIDPGKWPCPRASEGIGKCVSHFWSDGNDRKGKLLQDKRRRFGKAVRNHTERLARVEQTFACRFYHGLAQHSPCEGDLQMWVFQVMIDKPHKKGEDLELVPVANVRYAVITSTEDSAPVVRGTTSENGIIAVPMWQVNAQMRLRIDIFATLTAAIPDADKKKADDKTPPKSIDIEAPAAVADDEMTDPFKDEKTFLEFTLIGGSLERIVKKFPDDDPDNKPISLEPDSDEPDLTQDETTTGTRQRLFNLGYGVAEPRKWTDAQQTSFVKRFQTDKKLQDKSGTLTKETIDALREEYGS
jgi:hypothetical protein